MYKQYFFKHTSFICVPVITFPKDYYPTYIFLPESSPVEPYAEYISYLPLSSFDDFDNTRVIFLGYDEYESQVEFFDVNDVYNYMKIKPGYEFQVLKPFNCCFKIHTLYNFFVSKNKHTSLFVNNNTIKPTTIFFSDFDESLRWAKRSFGVVSPIRLIKLPINNYILENLNNHIDIVRFRFNIEHTIKHKPVSLNNYYIFKQKRYKMRSKVLESLKYYRDSTGKVTTNVRSRTRPFLINNSVFTNELKKDLSITLKLFQKNKNHGEIFPITLYKRLLRTRRTLVLPTHVNIAAITNSYDVVHSWFIPGLGLKLDCVPGRATHHSLYIDGAGFYYGQCAEICGRYHHHMPIKVCALPFEHFII